MHTFNEDTLNDNGDMLISICAQNELRINNTYFNHKEQQKYTFTNTRGQKSMIDYVITNRMVHPSEILDVRVLTSANVGTQHGLLLCKHRVSHIIKKKKPPNYVSKFNVESLKDESTKNFYQKRLGGKIAQNLITETDSVESAWKKVKENLVGSAKEALGERTVDTNRSRGNKPWFTPEIKELAKEKKEAYIKYIHNKTQESYEIYKEIRNRTTNEIKQLKKTYWERFSVEMEHDLYGGQKKIWNMLRKRKKPVNEEVQVNVINQETWTAHFENLYLHNDEEQEEVLNPPCDNNDSDNEHEYITQEEVQTTITKLKNRKSPGIDNITNELIKYGGPEITEELTKLFQKIERSVSIPEEWRTSITIPIHKKGPKTDPGNYRGIMLLSCVLKLLTKIIAQKITDKVGISEEQQGFRANRSTIDAIFILRQLVEKSIEYDKPMYLCFVDLKQAFDRVRLKDVLNLLTQKGVDMTYINLVREFNSHNKTKVKTNCGLTREINVSTGVRQGDSLSPCLFNIIMDEIIESVKGIDGGYTMNNRSLRILCYADDAVLAAENEDDLQRLLYKFSTTAEKFNMLISCEKTQSMVISKNPIRCKLVVNEHIINQVMNFNYLGVEISSERNTTNEVNNQINTSTRISGYLRDIIWRNKYMNTNSKVRIYKTCVRPVLTYAAESRAETSETKRKLRTTEMKILRTIRGITLRDRIRNEDTLLELGIQDVVRWVRTRRRCWRDHVDRMGPERLAKWAKTQKPNTRRPVGRPPKHWCESWASASQEGR